MLSRFTKATVPQGWGSTVAVKLFVDGAQLVMLGVLGVYLARVYDEVRARPLYVVRSRTGLGKAGAQCNEDARGVVSRRHNYFAELTALRSHHPKGRATLFFFDGRIDT